MLDWLTTLGAGAVGGLIVEAISFFGHVTAWRDERRHARAAGSRKLPRLTDHIDPVPDSLVALTRMAIGAIAGVVFHAEINGVAAAIAIGASGPALLRQLGSAQTVKAAVRGPDQPPPAEQVASGSRV
jgi:hypothetical protein